ncbi:MAG: bifunctional enoyl-CoA hydratase/phosphate acetyltransferase [Clostridiales bacterium]|nr:bifunctional enoyl-CoA hydratase/phosphate acetyltransferase [Clostridiales bacterium]
MIKKLHQVEDLLAGRPPGKIAVVAAHDINVLSSLKEAYDRGFAQPILIGNKGKIIDIANEIGFDLSGVNIIQQDNNHKSARVAIELAQRGEAQALMKGILPTADFMKAVLNREIGLKTDRLISHTMVIENKNYPKLLYVTDAAINIEPDLMQKVELINNSVDIAKALGVKKPKVAVLAAIEAVNPSMKSTLDAALLTQMNKRGQIEGCIVDGPLALDLAISPESVKQKKVKSDVAGDADVLLLPNIDAANILVKSLAFLQKSKMCHIITGSKAPLVVTSRSDGSMIKYYSIITALALCRNCK